MRILLALAFLLLLLPGGARAQDMLVVLDVSNSMLSRMDSRTRLASARIVIEALTRAVPVRARVGLMAFGHRRPSDCGDVEMLIGPGPVSPPVFNRQTNMTPRGRTPIAGALHEAAGKAAQLLLITDGGENCSPDPCGEVRALQARHPDLSIQVIGVDVGNPRDEETLRCIAAAGNGRYFPAPTIYEMAFAVAEAAGTGPLALPPTGVPVTPAPPGTDSILVLEANDLPGGAPTPVQNWTLVRLGETRRVVMDNNHTVQPTLRVPPGRYEAQLTAGNARIVERFEVEGERVTQRVVTWIGTLRPLGALGAARPARGGVWTITADEVPGYARGDEVTRTEGAEPVFRLTQGSYRLRFATGQASHEIPVFVEAGQMASARVNLGAAEITIIPTRGGRPIQAQMAEIRRRGETLVVATSNATRPRFVLPAGEWQARVQVENVWREMPMSLTVGQEAEIPLPLP